MVESKSIQGLVDFRSLFVPGDLALVDRLERRWSGGVQGGNGCWSRLRSPWSWEEYYSK